MFCRRWVWVDFLPSMLWCNLCMFRVRRVSSKLITIRLWAVPFNITVVQAYAPTLDSNDNEIESLIRHRRRNFYCARRLKCKSGQGCLWKVAKHLWTLLQWRRKWKRTQILWTLPPLTILCWQTLWSSHSIRRWTWHSPNGQHHNQIHSSEEALPIRSEQCQNTKFSRSRHWKWPRPADDDLPPSFEKNQQTKTHKTQDWPRKAERSQYVGNLPSYDRLGINTFHRHKEWRLRHRFNDHHLQYSSGWSIQWYLWQTSPEKKPPRSLHKFLICATKRENRERKDSNMKDLRNTRKWTTTLRGAWKGQKKTG